jgi:hypothetical protein
MNAIIGQLATSTVPTVNVESLCRDWAVDKEKVYALLNTLEHIGVINIVGYRNASKVGKGAKLLLAGPSLYACLWGNAWSSCEAYVVTMLRAADHQVFVCKDEAQRDFEVKKVTIEIGGSSMKPKKSAFRVRASEENFPFNRQIIEQFQLLAHFFQDHFRCIIFLLFFAALTQGRM